MAKKSKATEPKGKAPKAKRSKDPKPGKGKRLTRSQLALFEAAAKQEAEAARATAPGARDPAKAASPAAPAPVAAGEAASTEKGGNPEGGRARKGKRIISMAERMADRQREISISEFFTKNRHLLGFDNQQKALLTTIKEAVDNSLDACEEAKILPRIDIRIHELSETRFQVSIADNGPGIVHNQVGKVFGKLLYGSKFHRLKQARGQQGIGISAAVMYSQLTTGKPAVITSRTREDRPAHRLEVKIDTRKNAPDIVGDSVVEWPEPVPTGTKVEMEIEAVYRAGRRSVDAYIEQTAIANPHAEIRYTPPKGDELVFARLSPELPREAAEIKPHPHGVELGMLMTMFKDTRGRDLRGALSRDFSRVSHRVALEICQKAGVAPSRRPRSLTQAEAEAVHKAMGTVKIISPPTTCVVPIGEELLQAGLAKGVLADFYTSVTRSPAVYRGYPFQVEVGLAWGGNLPGDELCTLYRFANRVPLLYQQSDCAITKGVLDTDWRHYRVSQSRGALPTGPMVILVHVASVWVPFTSESKEAVARYPEMLREIKLALQVCGRRLANHLSARKRAAEEDRKFSYIETYIPHIGIALREILGFSESHETKLVAQLKDTLSRSRKFD